MKHVWMSVLKNMSGDNGEEYRLLSIRKDIIEDSIRKDGSEEMKALLRKRLIEEFFNNEVESFFEGLNLTGDMIDRCINELSMGKDCNILGERFWWEEEDVIVSLTDGKAEKKWIMTQESNVDGEIIFNVLVCENRKIALREMAEEIEWIKNESNHFAGFDQKEDEFNIEQSDQGFFITDKSDDYYEKISISEKEIIKE